MTKIFISHSSKDNEIIKSFIDDILVGALSVKISDIFCTSTDGTKIKSGEDWRNSIKDNLTSSKLTFLIITPNYKESEICQNEMGAAWVSASKVIPLIVPPINYSTVGIIQEPNQIEKLDDEKSLDRIKDIIQETLKISSSDIKSDRWTAKKNEFLLELKDHIKKNPFEPPLDRKEFQTKIKENIDLKITLKSLIEEKSELKNIVGVLSKAKDKEEVKKIKKNLGLTNHYDEFKELCKTVSDLLSEFDPIINGIIYISYSGKPLQIQWEGNKPELDEALARDHIDTSLSANFHDNSKMQKAYNALTKLNSFINSDKTKNDFIDMYEDEYDVNLDLDNMEFWEEVLDVNLRLK